MAFVEIERLGFGYGGGSLLFDKFTSSLIQHRTLGLLGASGSGKSTLLRLIAGLEAPTEGHIEFQDASPVATFVFQDAVLFEHLSRLENGLYRRGHGRHRERFTRERFDKLMAALSLDNGFLNDRRPLMTMSGGERQRLVLLRELSVGPDLILFDEPCTGLDPSVKREFLMAVTELLTELNVKCIYATHHLDELLPIADEIMYLYRKPNGSCAFSYQAIGQFLVAPPSADAAVSLYGPLATVLQGEAHLESGTGELLLSQNGRGARCTLVMPPWTVNASEEEGLSCEVLSETPQQALVRVHGQLLWVPCQFRPSAVLFNGPGYLYRDGMPSGAVDVITAGVESKWRIFLKQRS